jgi:hypothetical protein
MTHTPTRWKIEHTENGYQIGDSWVVATCPRCDDAVKIVHAFNCHDELVEALEIVLANASMPDDVRENAKQVLLKAEVSK